MSKQISIAYLLVFVIFYIIYGLSINTPSFENLKIVGTIGLLQFIFSIYTSIKNGQRVLSPYVIFLCVMYIFQVGQSLMYPFDVITERDLVGFLGITTKGVFQAQLVSFSFLSFFQIGALFYNQKKAIHITYHQNQTRYLYQNKRLLQVGWLLAIISIYPYYDELIHKAILSMLKGYGALYEGEEKIGLDNIQALVADYFIPALICLFIGYRQNKVRRKIIAGVLLLNCAIILVTGGRTEAVIIMFLLLILHNYLVKSFTRKDFIMICCGGALVLTLLASISQMRTSGSRSIEDTFTLSSDDDDNPLTEAISEMGSTMFCQIWTEEIVDETGDYRLGDSYIYSITSIIPNLGFWKIHPAKEHANLGDWLTTEKGLSFGTGYSMIAEAYINFWIFGALFMALLGYIAIKIFGRLNYAISVGNIAFVTFIIIIFWFSLKIPRNSFIGIIRALFYFALPVYWYTRGYVFKK